jgi:hypothetical protein
LKTVLPTGLNGQKFENLEYSKKIRVIKAKRFDRNPLIVKSNYILKFPWGFWYLVYDKYIFSYIFGKALVHKCPPLHG